MLLNPKQRISMLERSMSQLEKVLNEALTGLRNLAINVDGIVTILTEKFGEKEVKEMLEEAALKAVASMSGRSIEDVREEAAEKKREAEEEKYDNQRSSQ